MITKTTTKNDKAVIKALMAENGVLAMKIFCIGRYLNSCPCCSGIGKDADGVECWVCEGKGKL